MTSTMTVLEVSKPVAGVNSNDTMPLRWRLPGRRHVRYDRIKFVTVSDDGGEIWSWMVYCTASLT